MPYIIDPKTGMRTYLDPQTGKPLIDINQNQSRMSQQPNMSSITNAQPQSSRPQPQAPMTMQTQPQVQPQPQPQQGFSLSNFFMNMPLLPFAGLSLNQLKEKSLGGYLKNAGRDVTDIARGVAQIPSVAKQIAVGEVGLGDVAGQVASQTVNDYAELLADPGNTVYEKPVSTLLNVLPFTQVGKVGTAGRVANITDDVSDASRLANTTDDLGRVGKKLQDLSETSASKMLRASPTAYRKALENGVDINKTLTKISPKGKKTADVADYVGDIGNRGKGGIVFNKIQEAEKSIQNVVRNTKGRVVATDDLLKPLTELRDELKVIPGNGSKVQAIDDFIGETKQLYPRGLTVKETLNLKRNFDDIFGASVVDETGVAVATSQKVLANSARSILKERYPIIKEALDLESELYTIKPILNHAYAVSKTPGSGIRVGSATFDFTKPLTYADPLIQSEMATKWGVKLNELNARIPEIRKNIPSVNMPSVDENLRGTALIAPAIPAVGGLEEGGEDNFVQQNVENTISNQEEKTNAENYYNNVKNDTDQLNENIPQPETENQQPSFFGGLSKQEVMQLALTQGATLKDLQEISAVYDMVQPSNGLQDEETRKVVGDLRAEYFSRTKENGYIEAVNGYKKIQNLSDTPAGDVALVFAYMKMLDPSSVVRESEQSIAQNATSLSGRLKNYAERVGSGKRLNEQQRREFIESAEDLFNSVQTTQDQIDSLYADFAGSYGVDPELIGIGKIGL